MTRCFDLRAAGSLRDLGLRIKWVDLALGPGFAVASLIGVGIIAQVISQLGIHPRRSSLVGPVDRGTLTVVIIVLIAVVGAPIVEELFFRGLLQRSLLRRTGPVAAVATSSVVFGVTHFQLLQFPALVAFGAVLGTLAYKTGRLGPGIVAHMAFNAVTVIALNVSALQRFENKAEIDEQALRDARLVQGDCARIKFLGAGELTKALTVKAHSFSPSARQKIEAAGGTVVEIAPAAGEAAASAAS